jgi:hypothetical protein
MFFVLEQRTEQVYRNADNRDYTLKAFFVSFGEALNKRVERK